jgi:hypothetical protein
MVLFVLYEFRTIPNESLKIFPRFCLIGRFPSDPLITMTYYYHVGTRVPHGVHYRHQKRFCHHHEQNGAGTRAVVSRERERSLACSLESGF